ATCQGAYEDDPRRRGDAPVPVCSGRRARREGAEAARSRAGAAPAAGRVASGGDGGLDLGGEQAGRRGDGRGPRDVEEAGVPAPPRRRHGRRRLAAALRVHGAPRAAANARAPARRDGDVSAIDTRPNPLRQGRKAPILFPVTSVNHTLPLVAAAMPVGSLSRVWTPNSVKTPEVVRRPIL